MNRSEAQALLVNIELVRAYANGQEIQVRPHDGGAGWIDLADPHFTLKPECYRIKPRPVEGWVNVYPNESAGLYPTKARADQGAMTDRIACVFVRQVEKE